MIDEGAYRSIGELKAKCMLLESQVAALLALTRAGLEMGVPRRDELETRWSKNLALELVELGKQLGTAS